MSLPVTYYREDKDSNIKDTDFEELKVVPRSKCIKRWAGKVEVAYN
jgi:hypothetical protein